jgi:hypothetical protein
VKSKEEKERRKETRRGGEHVKGVVALDQSIRPFSSFTLPLVVMSVLVICASHVLPSHTSHIGRDAS